MRRILVLGAGKIGRMIAKMLVDSGDYRVIIADVERESVEAAVSQGPVDGRCVDASDLNALQAAMRGCEAVVSALSYRFNPGVAEAALRAGVSYFDLTEDVATTRRVREIALQAKPGQVFMPQCGLAPGFISIVAQSLTQQMDRLDRLHMRVGALPQFPTGQLKYNLTWSTDGLINEYCNRCEAIEGGQRVSLLPLEGLEQFSLDGVRYEAFNTSGGLGTLCETLDGQIRELNYKTVRYQGHRNLMQFLLQDLRLADRRELLKEILEQSIPLTFQDVVVTFCSVTGWQHGHLVQCSDARKLYSQTIDGQVWSAIQITTAAAVCAVVDLMVEGKLPTQGFVCQEQVTLDEFIGNRFGRWYVCHEGNRNEEPGSLRSS